MSAQSVRVDYKPRVTIAERRALWTRRAAEEFNEAEHERRIRKTEYWGGVAIGFLSGGPFWILLCTIVFALVLGWTPHDGIGL
jgi:hypothetical protein